ncbi:MAG: hypothetical protein KJ061_14460 [Vicinamibacteraceae bacterium]|nr:hypothetical protein [Vicinamibacteraceae bacterium]
MMRPAWLVVRQGGWFLISAAVFAVLVTSNSAGYRFGVSDQAFYIPAIRRALTPGLFPRDAALVDAQSRLLAADQLMAWTAAATGLDLPALFALGYLLTVVLFAGGTWLVATALYRTRWAGVALLGALAFRHRITGTGVNTFEGYFHPRTLTFAIGLVAIGAVLRQRWLLAGALVGTGFLVHPTTALWFALWVGTAVFVSVPRLRRPALTLAAGGAGVAVWMVVSGPLAGSLTTMDAEWMAALASKDYLFPSDWSLETWAVNALAPVVLGALFLVRRRAGLVTREEAAVVAGCGALFLLFLVVLPLIEARVALAVQLQVSRVLWPVEFLATAYLVWALCEWAPRGRSARGGPEVAKNENTPDPVSSFRRPAAVAIALLIAAGVRGYHVLEVEHNRPLVSRELPDTAWLETGEWAESHTPLDAHFLMDQGHAWRYGVSFRVAGERDVLLEHVKDSAMGLYSRAVALRVLERDRAIGDFSRLTPERVVQLAERYDLDYLVADRTFPFPVAFRSGTFRVYSIGETARR